MGAGHVQDQQNPLKHGHEVTTPLSSPAQVSRHVCKGMGPGTHWSSYDEPIN